MSPEFRMPLTTEEERAERVNQYRQTTIVALEEQKGAPLDGDELTQVEQLIHEMVARGRAAGEMALAEGNIQ